MRFGLKESLLQDIINVLSGDKSVLKAVIFGSRARGDYKYNSDIDLAVYCNKEMSAGLSLDLDDAAGIYKIDVVDMTRLTNQALHKRIEEQGIEIYSR